MTDPDKLTALAREAAQRFAALPEAERRLIKSLQRASYIRGMTTPCDHGILDFEQCGDCRAQSTETRDAG